MQQAFGVSRITVRQALNELQAEGLIETLNGKGSFVPRPADAPRLRHLVEVAEAGVGPEVSWPSGWRRKTP